MWQQAALLTGFSLYQPVDQRPAPDSTDVRVWYSSSAIYFGIRAFEPHGAVAATLADRDRISADDYVEIHLDTFDERNRALVFIVNPLGVQADGTKSENGGFIPGSNVMPGQNDLSADFVWQSRGTSRRWGYEVEVRIPFSSLRYRGSAVQRWGLQIDRTCSAQRLRGDVDAGEARVGVVHRAGGPARRTYVECITDGTSSSIRRSRTR